MILIGSKSKSMILSHTRAMNSEIFVMLHAQQLQRFRRGIPHDGFALVFALQCMANPHIRSERASG